MIKKTAHYFTTAYLLLMFCVYPFYVENGYENMGEAKNRFYLAVSMAAFAILFVLYVIHWIGRAKENRKNGQAYLIDWEQVSVVDLLMLLYATEIFLSYVFSNNKEEALWGTEGWYMGLAPLLLLCGLYFFISRFWLGNEKILYLFMISSSIVFSLGICNRFSWYPIDFKGAQPDFISTLGNINWFCGFLSVVASLGIALFVVGEFNRIWKRGTVGLYAVITFMAGFAQGSDSIFLWFGAVFFLLLWIGVEKREYLSKWFLLVFLWGMSAQVVRVLRIFTVDKYNYDTDGFCGYFTDSSLSLWIALAALTGYFLMKWIKKFGGEKVKMLLAVSPVVFLVTWIIVSVINTKAGLPFLQENSLLTFNSNWGNGRGATFYAGIKTFAELPLSQKLLGAGPDCFATAAYGIPEVASLLRENFGAARLTNAHNEIITGLVNTGILGVGLYVGILFTCIGRYLKAGRQNMIFYLFAVSIFGYFMHNMVSFAQVLNLPFLFLVLGMGEAKKRIC